jgi:hypothetical protein
LFFISTLVGWMMLDGCCWFGQKLKVLKFNGCNVKNWKQTALTVVNEHAGLALNRLMMDDAVLYSKSNTVPTSYK